MSILIKGMKMPKEGCKDCPLVKRGRVFDICPFLKREVGGNVERGGKPYNCPLIELPDHGDLIDKTDLMVSLADWQLSEAPEEGINWDSGRNVTSHELQYSIYRLLGDVYEEVRDEPVIIPAERSEE